MPSPCPFCAFSQAPSDDKPRIRPVARPKGTANRGQRQPQPGAGIICFHEAAHPEHRVCIVANDNALSLPKGRPEPGDWAPVITALREWKEETNLPTAGLVIYPSPVVDAWGAHYYVATWKGPAMYSSWDVHDPDPTGPVWQAHWAHVSCIWEHRALSRSKSHCLALARDKLPSLVCSIAGPLTGLVAGSSRSAVQRGDYLLARTPTLPLATVEAPSTGTRTEVQALQPTRYLGPVHAVMTNEHGLGLLVPTWHRSHDPFDPHDDLPLCWINIRLGEGCPWSVLSAGQLRDWHGRGWVTTMLDHGCHGSDPR
jgi:8-oxo-dGTP pyrophosphatase MutT (NUDIX family)